MGARSSQPRSPHLNKTDGHLLEYFRNTFVEGGGGTNPVSARSGITATGGVISDYTDGPTIYRAHVFTSTGEFDVTDTTSDFGADVEYLVVAGGGAAGWQYHTATFGIRNSGGGGAGGLLTNVPGIQDAASTPLTGNSFTVSAQPYAVVVGGGGAGSLDVPAPLTTTIGRGINGSDSSFGGTIVAAGGGGGASPHGANYANDPEYNIGKDGGSGGGGGGTGDPGDPGGASTPSTPKQGAFGYPGEAGAGGGGGGASGPTSDPSSHVQNGMDGIQVAIAGPAADTTGVGALNPGPGQYQWFAGGGAGGAPSGTASGGVGGGASQSGTFAGEASTGGGGACNIGGSTGGGAGGSGIVIVRYQIGTVSDTKATGGSVSFYGGKTIHAFVNSGTFIVPGSFNETVEYVVVGGGGAGGGPSIQPADSYYGAGGGAGAYIKGTTPISTPQTIAIQVGAGGAKGQLTPVAGSPSYFGTPITAPGGGFGATWQDGLAGNRNGGPGGSSGGATYGGPGTAEPATGSTFSPTDASANTPTSGWGHVGGLGDPEGNSGGGGGAGGVGQAADPTNGGDGGLGIQLPTTFRDPAQSFGAPGPTNTSTDNPGWTNVDNSGKFWLAGGGGGTANRTFPATAPGIGGGNGAPGGPYSGAGDAKRTWGGGGAAIQNTGSGGGGSERLQTDPERADNFSADAGNGGSGIVLIAYPT